MRQKLLPALALAPVAFGVPAYVYSAHQSNKASELPDALFCVSDLMCEGSADACRDASAPLKVTRGDDFNGKMQFDNGADLSGRITAVAGQMTGAFKDQNGGTWDLEIFADGEFTLMNRTPDRRGTDIGALQETYYQGTCERVN